MTSGHDDDADRPVLRSVDAVTVPVPDLDAGLAFYCDRLGHRLLWRNDAVGQAGVQLPDGDGELVIGEGRRQRPTRRGRGADRPSMGRTAGQAARAGQCEPVNRSAAARGNP